MIASLISDSNLHYPPDTEFFSPDEKWPEYPFSHVSRIKNDVYRAVRNCFANAGLDKENFNSDRWNPLGEYISSGQSVFLLCNFVEQQVAIGSKDLLFAKCTHGSVVRAVIDYVLIALKGK